MTALHAPFYYVISIKFNSLAPGGKNINPLLLHTSLNIIFAASSSITSLSFPNLYPQMAYLKAPRWANVREQDLGCVMERKGRSIRVLGLFPVSSHFCVFVRWLVDGEFQQYFCEFELSRKKLLQDFKCLNVQIRVNGFTTWYNVYHYHPFFIPKSVAMTFPVEVLTL